MLASYTQCKGAAEEPMLFQLCNADRLGAGCCILDMSNMRPAAQAHVGTCALQVDWNKAELQS